MSDDLQLAREDDVLVFTYGLLGEMKEHGLVQGGVYQLAELGRQRYEQLREAGFWPTDEEVARAMRTIHVGESAAIAEAEA